MGGLLGDDGEEKRIGIRARRHSRRCLGRSGRHGARWAAHGRGGGGGGGGTVAARGGDVVVRHEVGVQGLAAVVAGPREDRLHAGPVWTRRGLGAGGGEGRGRGGTERAGGGHLGGAAQAALPARGTGGAGGGGGEGRLVEGVFRPGVAL